MGLWMVLFLVWLLACWGFLALEVHFDFRVYSRPFFFTAGWVLPVTLGVLAVLGA